MKTWKKIALGVVALGLVGKMFGGDDAQQQQRETITVNDQPKQEQKASREDVLNDMVKTDLPNYKDYTYMRSEHFANATNLAQAQQYKGKYQVNHMKMIGIEGDLVGLQSEDGCNMILTLPADEEKRSSVITPLQWVEEPLVFVTITRIGRGDDGKFIYLGTIEAVGAKTKNVGGLE